MLGQLPEHLTRPDSRSTPRGRQRHFQKHSAARGRGALRQVSQLPSDGDGPMTPGEDEEEGL